MRLWMILAGAMLALLPAVALGQGPEDDHDDSFNLRINDDYVLPPGDTIATAIVINADAAIDGTVEDTLVVINGDATIQGTANDVRVINGSLTLGPQSVVEDVSLVDSELTEEPGSQINGSVDRDARWALWGTGALILFGIGFWIAMTLFVLVAGLAFAAVAGAQLVRATQLMAESVGGSILAGVLTMILLPIAAILLVVTLVGIPLGITMLLVVLPALLLLGYIVAGTWLGSLILNRTNAPTGAIHPYASAALGLIILQLLILIPGVAPLIFLLAGIWGMGGLVLLGWRNFRSPPAATVVTPGGEASPA